jgi:hypothetical protein
MNAIIDELSKPVWWFTVVVAGIAINLLSTYVRNKLDSALSRYSAWWRSKSERRKAAWEKRITSILENDDFRAMCIHREVRLRVDAVFFLLAALVILSLPALFSSVGLSPLPRWATMIMLAVFMAIFLIAFVTYHAAQTLSIELMEVAWRRRMLGRIS